MLLWAGGWSQSNENVTTYRCRTDSVLCNSVSKQQKFKWSDSETDELSTRETTFSAHDDGFSSCMHFCCTCRCRPPFKPRSRSSPRSRSRSSLHLCAPSGQSSVLLCKPCSSLNLHIQQSQGPWRKLLFPKEERKPAADRYDSDSTGPAISASCCRSLLHVVSCMNEPRWNLNTL